MPIGQQSLGDAPARTQRSLSFYDSNGHAEPDTAAWDLGARDTSMCLKCGTHLSASYRRVWADNDGKVEYCRACVPRSVRYGDDVYDRDPEDFGPDDFDVESPNKGRDPGGVRRNGTPEESLSGP